MTTIPMNLVIVAEAEVTHGPASQAEIEPAPADANQEED